ncbi:MAG: SDR family oxidoreductase [Mesorhizobium sp.]|uniref:SDR family NAD(P)-dependent oxidoreductase n=1 Tax=Mesorhizobium sp. TaxID=1871066 RepID=UPI000FE97C88|nr:SDR family oxidoreductase [Mesorhizobium sp.]RWI57106.1 MAG: SDR family oxidoreductase [Mesorhizobium sp.]
MEISDKCAIVIGGGNGIGRAIALAIAQKGGRVVVADYDMRAAEGVSDRIAADGGIARAFEVDVADYSSVQALAEFTWELHGRGDILVNCAGVLQPAAPLLETSIAEYEWVFSVNVGGTLNALRAIGGRMVAGSTPAWIVNTGSEHSFGVPHKSGGLYTASKHAVLGLTDVLARELPKHVGISILCPGLVATTLCRSSERRQAAFGGAQMQPADGGQLMNMGMQADKVADCVLRGIEREDFYILTHPQVIEYAEARWRAIESAFASQAPRYEGDDKYTVRHLINKLRAAID